MVMVLDTSKSILGSQQWLQFHIWLLMTLNYEIRQILLQNATAILLQDMAKVYCKTRQDFYYKLRRFYFKMKQLVQNATFITKFVGTDA